jgi:hypothetical protein
LQNKLIDITRARIHLQSLLSKLREFRSSDRFFNSIYNHLDINESTSQRLRNDELLDKKQQLRHIFFEILDTVINQTEIKM